MSNIQPGTTWRPNEQLAVRKNLYVSENLSDGDEIDSFSVWEPKIEQHPRHSGTLGPDIEAEVPMPQNDEAEAGGESIKITPVQFEKKLKIEYERGFADGEKQTEKGFQSHREQILDLIEGFQKAQSDLSAYYSPLATLAVAIAEQLVRAELSFSNVALEGLVKKVLAEIEALAEGPVSVWMNPQDLEVAREVLQNEYSHVSFESDAGLSRASVRVVMDDTAIEDIRENRLEHLVTDMLLQKNVQEDDSSTIISERINDISTDVDVVEAREDGEG